MATRAARERWHGGSDAGAAYVFRRTTGGRLDKTWTLDLRGNWVSTTTNGVTQTRTHNAVNEITDISGDWADPAYDAAGNMASGPRGDEPAKRLHLVYDAWNRLAKVYDDDGITAGTFDANDTLRATYRYDGLHRRVRRIVVGFDGNSTPHDIYYGAGPAMSAAAGGVEWQRLEVRRFGDTVAYEQYLWDVRYVDAPICRWHDADNDGTFEPDANEMHYYTNGANFNVTALLDANSGDVVERYLYDPYGRRTVLNGHTDADPNVTEWHPDGDNRSDANNPLGHQGLPHDAETGYIHNRNRYRCSMIGRWLQWDFLQYPDGMSLCQYLGSAPTLGTDPSGLEATTQPNVQWSPFLSSKHADYPYTSHYYADTIACPGGPASLEYMVGHQLMGYTQRRPNGEPQRRPDGTVVRVGAQDLLTSPDLPCKAPFNAVRRIQTSLKTWVYKIIGQGERYDTKTYLEGRYGIGAMITQKKDKDGCICWKLKFIVTFWELKGYPPVDELPERRRRFVSDPTVGKNHHWFSQGRSVYPAKGNAGVPLAVGASDLAPGGAAGTEKAGIELEMRRWVCCRAPDVETGVMIVDCPYIKVPVKAVLGRARTHPGQVKPVFWNVVQLWGENGIQSQQGNMQKPPQKD